ncbi:hypothetical protein J2Z21_008780 [Streptomyces griseochromogenes]|uniref:Uncharacterized protein n=1 Tax=Streptomyces griseochromogenes TaxID=68214 RepID=A0A1B1B0H8_9ACTN|nr:hypothetical protein [Streptomyces griseochromogenes]ANP52343.1 hypothetical protein AVL59_24855 [Streptomyces griseochromogenes]MBP2055764.1 hypothetical protein [Streptomyces griseochromogenes]
MSEIVVYELEKPTAARFSPVPSGGAERRVRKVHVAPAAPGSRTVAGPRTLCGKDTFAMETASWTPSERPGAPWYPAEYASVVCPDCDAVIEI